jgi:hypothetical protein
MVKSKRNPLFLHGKEKGKVQKRKERLKTLPKDMHEKMTMRRIRISDVQRWEECQGADILDFE